MKKNYILATCGLSCDLCDANSTKIKDSAAYLLKVFEDPMFASVLTFTTPEINPNNLPVFQETLDVLKMFPPCPGCQERQECPINQCVKEKGINNCSECKFLDIENERCNAIPTSTKVPMMPPAPIYLNGLVKRYQGWNIKNLKTLKEGKKKELNMNLEIMEKEGKSSRDLIDTSVNLFEMRNE